MSSSRRTTRTRAPASWRSCSACRGRKPTPSSPPVYVNETLTLDFAEDGEPFRGLHFCFHVSDEEFDAIHGRLLAAGTPYQSTPHGGVDRRINYAHGGKNLYWSDADGHFWEILTVSYARPPAPSPTPSSP